MVINLESDTLECEVTWALESITKNEASGGDGIPPELFQILKMMLLKCCIQYASEFGKQQWPQDWKRSVCIPIPKKDSAKGCSNYQIVKLVSHASKIMLKILQARLQQYVNRELPDVPAEFRKGRENKDEITNIRRIIEKEREFQKNIHFCYTDYTKASDCVDHNKLWKT